MTDNEQREKWHQDEGRWRWAFGILVSIALVTGGHAITAVWWAGTINTRMEQTQQQSNRNAADINQLRAQASMDRNLAGRIEERLSAQGETLRRIEEHLRRLEERP